MIAFVSDIHLGSNHIAESAVREQRALRWLDWAGSCCDEIFLVGDVFDFWYEYKRVVPKGSVRFLAKLAELTSRGVKIHLFEGNHDMWQHDYLTVECGVELHSGALVIERSGHKLYVVHGDEIYARRIGGLTALMNSIFRNRTIRYLFSHLIHPDAALRFGFWWTSSSAAKRGEPYPFRGEGDYMVQFARDYAKVDPRVDCFVFGHNHCGVEWPLGEGRTAYFLGEWARCPKMLTIDDDGTIRFQNVEI